MRERPERDPREAVNPAAGHWMVALDSRSPSPQLESPSRGVELFNAISMETPQDGEADIQTF